MRHFPKPMTIVVIIVIALGAIWIANNVTSVGKLVGPKPVK